MELVRDCEKMQFLFSNFPEIIFCFINLTLKDSTALKKAYMGNKIYIHIGMPKTGSTWLQTEFFPKVDSHDIIYKERFRKLMYYLTDKDKIITYENYVGYSHLVKNRNLDGWLKTRDKAFSNLSKLFPNADIILVVREQVELIRSLYNQYVKVGESVNFEDYWDCKRKYTIDKEALLYRRLIEELKASFRGRILVLGFDLFKKDKGKFIEILSKYVGGINDIDFAINTENIINKSLKAREIRSLLFFYKYFGNAYNPEALIVLRKRLFKIMRYFVVKWLSIIFSNKSVESEEILKEIETYYSEDWKYISSRLDGGYFIIDR